MGRDGRSLARAERARISFAGAGNAQLAERFCKLISDTIKTAIDIGCE
jgi:hypothetical protein